MGSESETIKWCYFQNSQNTQIWEQRVEIGLALLSIPSNDSFTESLLPVLATLSFACKEKNAFIRAYSTSIEFEEKTDTWPF